MSFMDFSSIVCIIFFREMMYDFFVVSQKVGQGTVTPTRIVRCLMFSFKMIHNCNSCSGLFKCYAWTIKSPFKCLCIWGFSKLIDNSRTIAAMLKILSWFSQQGFQFFCFNFNLYLTECLILSSACCSR